MKKKYLIICLIILIMSFSIYYFKRTTTVKTLLNDNKVISKIPSIETINFNETRNNKTQTKSASKTDIVGNIRINGTNINEKLVQGIDNEYYLNHNTNKDKNTIGSIFIDYRNTFKDRKILIYGHNSKTLKSALFHDLEKFINESFYKKYKYIDLILNGQETKWEIFSVMIIKQNDNRHMKITFNDKEWIKHINWMKKESLYDTGIELGLSDRIISLQTCYYNPDNSYLVINAKLIK